MNRLSKLFLGLLLCCTVLVSCGDGNFLFDVTLSENLKVISLDEETNMLYGVDLNDNVYKYDLSNLLCDIK